MSRRGGRCCRCRSTHPALPPAPPA
jgi:hypothetical protein